MNCDDQSFNDQESLKFAAEKIYHLWENGLENNDVESLLSLYTVDATIESPFIHYLLKTSSGICQGREDLRLFFERAIQCKSSIRRYYRKHFFTDGKIVLFEYPRETPKGEQMDFSEVMEIQNGLIQYHKVYWGWRGFKVIKDDLYWR